ncbi:hypothetical protein IE53DRAFT_279410 [Violaceomyces palustris]|uniref:Uncharacterized protein n=1 Tax=Violaceomyces palustris TaxID=1673888 RepID=A0ACD0NMH1_9BASI|nr:hypothetical protein IE53DRAFT_279410 [Violaceomyces palustris]
MMIVSYERVDTLALVSFTATRARPHASDIRWGGTCMMDVCLCFALSLSFSFPPTLPPYFLLYLPLFRTISHTHTHTHTHKPTQTHGEIGTMSTNPKGEARKGARSKEEISKLKVVELREELKSRGIDHGGLKKAELVQKLLEAEEGGPEKEEEEEEEERADYDEEGIGKGSGMMVSGAGGDRQTERAQEEEERDDERGQDGVEAEEETRSEQEKDSIQTSNDQVSDGKRKLDQVEAEEDAGKEPDVEPTPATREKRLKVDEKEEEKDHDLGTQAEVHKNGDHEKLTSLSQRLGPPPPAVEGKGEDDEGKTRRKGEEGKSEARKKIPGAVGAEQEHPPTRSLYITNLVRPLTLTQVKKVLSEFGELDSVLPPNLQGQAAAEARTPLVYEGVWLDGIKSHAYCTFKSIDSAVEARAKLSGSKFPDETGRRVKLDHVPTGMVRSLIEREEEAWNDGRRRLELLVVKRDQTGSEDQDGVGEDVVDEVGEKGFSFQLIPVGEEGKGSKRGPPPPPPPPPLPPAAVPKDLEDNLPAASKVDDANQHSRNGGSGRGSGRGGQHYRVRGRAKGYPPPRRPLDEDFESKERPRESDGNRARDRGLRGEDPRGAWGRGGGWEGRSGGGGARHHHHHHHHHHRHRHDGSDARDDPPPPQPRQREAGHTASSSTRMTSLGGGDSWSRERDGPVERERERERERDGPVERERERERDGPGERESGRWSGHGRAAGGGGLPPQSDVFESRRDSTRRRGGGGDGYGWKAARGGERERERPRYEQQQQQGRGWERERERERERVPPPRETRGGDRWSPGRR